MRYPIAYLGIMTLFLLPQVGCSGEDGADTPAEDGGTSVDSGACDQVECLTPPANICQDGSTLVVYNSQGTCTDGACSYASTTQVCADGCEDGACIGDPCAGVTCATPPANTCQDATTLVVYNSQGTCTDGACSYASTTQVCTDGCEDGACIGDPCAGVTCATPPANTCQDATTLVVYNSQGTCTDGACSYASTTQVCTDGCESGACIGDPCAGVTCATPPANTCQDATTLVAHNAQGTCANGVCEYGSSTQTCEHGCENGACKNDPCIGVTCATPPANTCQDAATLLVYSTPGTCSNGACEYGSTTQTCEHGCENGACKGDPCIGVTCATPPANTCQDATTLLVYSTPGTCSNGACEYGSTTQTCEHGCENGACKNDPCAGVTCVTPPANTCQDATTLLEYGTSGTCTNGICEYEPTAQTCDYGCESGACNSNPGVITGGPCLSGAPGQTAYRVQWNSAYVSYEVNGLPDQNDHTGVYGYSIGFTPQYVDTYLGDGGVLLNSSDFIDIELSTLGVSSISSITLSLYGRSYATTSSGSFNWQTFEGTGASPSGLVSNSTPYEWYSTDLTSGMSAADGGILLRIKAGPPSSSLVVNRLEICMEAQ